MNRIGLFLAGLFMERMLSKFWAILHQLKPLRPASLLDHAVVPLSGLRALKPHILTHDTKPSHKKPKRPEMKTTCGQQLPAGSQTSTIGELLEDFCNNPGSNRLATFANSESALLFQSDWFTEFHLNLDIVARHAHLRTTQQFG